MFENKFSGDQFENLILFSGIYVSILILLILIKMEGIVITYQYIILTT